MVKIDGVKTPPNVPKPVAWAAEFGPVGNEFVSEDDFTCGMDTQKIRACLLLQIENYDDNYVNRLY